MFSVNGSQSNIRSDEKMSFLTKIKDEIKFENVELTEDFFSSYDDSFVDSSKLLDYRFDNNFTTEEDPLSLDQKLGNNINEKCVFIAKQSVNNLKSKNSVVNIGLTTVNLPSNEIDKNIFICHICKKNVNRLKYDNYIKTEHTYTKLHNFLEMERMKPSSEQRYLCKFCSVVSKSPRLYLLHLAKHGKEFQQCNYCPQRWKVKDFLKPHTRFNEYPCELCGKSLTKKSSYVAHMSSHYQKQCKICNKMFSKFGCLLAHLQWCKRRTSCSGCSQRFSTLVALKDHRLVCEEIQKFNMFNG